MRGAMHVEPVLGQALEAGDLVANFIVENLGAAAGNGVEAGVAQAKNRVADRKPAVLGDRDDLGSRVTVQVNLRETIFDSAQHLLVPVDFQVGMQAALHQHSRTAKFHGLTDLVVNRVEVEDVAVFRGRPLQRAIEGAEGAVLGAKVRVIDVAVDDVGDHALGMQPTAHRVGFHADADQVIGGEHLERLLLGQGHGELFILTEGGGLLQMRCQAVRLAARAGDAFLHRKYWMSDTAAPIHARPTRIPTAGL